MTEPDKRTRGPGSRRSGIYIYYYPPSPLSLSLLLQISDRTNFAAVVLSLSTSKLPPSRRTSDLPQLTHSHDRQDKRHDNHNSHFYDSHNTQISHCCCISRIPLDLRWNLSSHIHVALNYSAYSTRQFCCCCCCGSRSNSGSNLHNTVLFRSQPPDLQPRISLFISTEAPVTRTTISSNFTPGAYPRP